MTCNFCHKLGHKEIFCFKILNKHGNEELQPKRSEMKSSSVELQSNTVMSNSVISNQVKISNVLPVAKVNVTNSVNKFSVFARVIIDTGSQVSFITSKLVSNLNLKIVNKIVLS